MKLLENGDWIKYSPYDRFSFFIAPKIDRYKTLLQTIEKLSLNSYVISIEENHHIFIFPPGKTLPRMKGGSFPFAGDSPYLFTAHYDRVEGSPGANDNSIAVFHLLRAASLLSKKNIGNWMIIFTDKEELAAGESIDKQGSYALAQKLKLWGLEKARIFNFDAIGTGDVFIISTTTDEILKNSDNSNLLAVRDNIRHLRNHALETANYLRTEKVLLAPTPFSDDIGFLRAGLAAQTITILPSGEAAQYEEALRKYPNFSKMLISGEIKTSPEKKHLPVTWRNMNTPADNSSRLTPQFFDQIVHYMVVLIK